MINTAKFKGRMIEKGYIYQSLAPKISCTAYTLGQKIANETPTTLEEAMTLSEELDIKKEEFAEFFLI